eukprot:2784013-Amphidinium_carterae.1
MDASHNKVANHSVMENGMGVRVCARAHYCLRSPKEGEGVIGFTVSPLADCRHAWCPFTPIVFAVTRVDRAVQLALLPPP